MARTDWFIDARFGMFIHWGLYALGARHEWLMNYEKIDPAAYRERYFGRFDPEKSMPVSLRSPRIHGEPRASGEGDERPHQKHRRQPKLLHRSDGGGLEALT